MKGYFIHLITDHYWFKILDSEIFVGEELKDLSDEEQKELYYEETDQIDFNIYKSEKWREEVWELLEESRSFNYGELLTSQEITKWKERTFSFFSDDTKEPQIKPEYITEKVVEKFIERTTIKSKNILKSWESDT